MAAEALSIIYARQQISFHPDEQVLFSRDAVDFMVVMLEGYLPNLHLKSFVLSVYGQLSTLRWENFFPARE